MITRCELVREAQADNHPDYPQPVSIVEADTMGRDHEGGSPNHSRVSLDVLLREEALGSER